MKKALEEIENEFFLMIVSVEGIVMENDNEVTQQALDVAFEAGDKLRSIIEAYELSLTTNFK